MKQRLEQTRVQAIAGKGLAFSQDTDGIMAVQTFLMAGNHPKIPNSRRRVKLFAK